MQKLNYTWQILPYANDISDFKVYGPFRRDINPDDLSLEARRTRTPSCKTKSDPHVQVVQAGILFCRYRDGRRTVHTLIRKGYHGGGIISVRSSDLPRVGYRPRTDPGPRRLRLPSMGSSMHGRPFMATVYVVQRPGPPFSPTIVDNTGTKVASKRIAFFRFSSCSPAQGRKMLEFCGGIENMKGRLVPKLLQKFSRGRWVRDAI